MQCNKTGLTDNNWKTILDVLNVYNPNDIMHVYPEMGSREFVQDVAGAFQKVRAHVLRLNVMEPLGDAQESKVKPVRCNSDVTLTQEELDDVREASFGK